MKSRYTSAEMMPTFTFRVIIKTCVDFRQMYTLSVRLSVSVGNGNRKKMMFEKHTCLLSIVYRNVAYVRRHFIKDFIKDFINPW